MHASPAFIRARTEGRYETRRLYRLDVCLGMSEKEVAGVSFSTQNGKLDHLDFRGLDERSIRWCKNLFEYYWEKAKRI
jgi:predicted transcriptional regulator